MCSVEKSHDVVFACWQRLAEHVTKNSPSLQRDAQYMKTVSPASSTHRGGDIVFANFCCCYNDFHLGRRD